MGGNSAETLLPVNLHSNEGGGGGGEQRWGSPICIKLQFFIFDIKFTIYSSSFGKSCSWLKKKYHVLFMFPALSKTEILKYNHFRERCINIGVKCQISCDISKSNTKNWL